MESQAVRYGWVLRLDRGEEIVGSLGAFAADKGVRSGLLSGLGAAGPVELGYFDWATKTYARRRFEGEYEIGSLTGNLSEREGKPYPHCHVVLGDAHFAAHAGHLFEGVVCVTCEIQIVTDPDVLLRVARPDLGFYPLEPRGGPPSP